MSVLNHAVHHQHATSNTVYHALHGYYYGGRTTQELSAIYSKSDRTIRGWICRFEKEKEYRRHSKSHKSPFGEEERQWVKRFYDTMPLSFLDEAKAAFEEQFKRTISVSTIWRILREIGYTYKVLERRAMNIKMKDIQRFVHELSLIDWSQHNLQFLDEVSFDNRGMLRKRGYCLKGQKLVFRGEFQRKARISLLCFINMYGVVETFYTDGTFDRQKFVDCCHSHATSGKSVMQYLGSGSVWILDGASIHCHPDLIYCIRSLGIVPIYLPAYYPFFNPIEYLFGVMKKAMQRHYLKNSKRSLLHFVAEVVDNFRTFNMQSIFEHCGWTKNGCFDPRESLGNDKVKLPDDQQQDVYDLLDFVERDDYE
ncbi:hypothetical protein LEN26_016431 [Aphanomyces euteiches]|nr:hypothetical protein LEN26_016431 [Aphanomyces euteiches]